MAQFNFGNTPGNPNAAPNFNFGAKPAAPAFGALASPQPSGSITFGTPVASTAQNTGLAFGSNLGFGTPTSATTPSAGFGFAAQTPKTTGLPFGTPTAAPNLSFGAIPTTGAGLTFGTPVSTATGGLNFGTPVATATGGLNFGTPAPTTAANLSFGTPVPAATTNLTFGTPIATTAAGLSFNTPSTASTGLAFGATPIAAPPAPVAATGLAFGTPASTVGFSLGTTTATTTSSGFFGGTTPIATTTQGAISFATPVATTSTGFSLGGGLGGTNLSLKPALGATSLSFGGPTTAASTGTTATGLSFGLGTTSITTTTQTLNFSFGTTAKPQTSTLSLGTTTTQSASVGLGGVDTSLQKSGAATTGRVDTIAAKENFVPNEILQTIENFKIFVKDQKGHSSDVSRGSARPFLKVGQDIDLLMSTLSEVDNELQKNQQIASKLKYDSAKCLQNAEMAQRTNDTPPGLQFENNAPMQYFIEIVNKFEQDIQALRMQIDITDRHIHSLSETKFLTSQELSLGMRRLHDTFVALAGRLQSVHQQVESQKEQYLNLRKYILKDPTDIFLKPMKDIKDIEKKTVPLQNVPSIPGPNPFSTLGASNTGMMMMAPQQVPNKPPPAYPTGNTSLNFGTANATPLSNPIVGNTSIFSGAGTSLFGTSPQVGQITPGTPGFQLQNPPLGNKRGKR